MSRTKECDCVSCPQGCIHCGRDIPYTLVRCDWCSQNTIREENFEEEDWYTVNIKGRYGSGPYTQDMCSKCHDDVLELLVNFRGGFDIFKEEVKTFSREAISEAEHDKYISMMDEWLDMLDSCLNGN